MTKYLAAICHDVSHCVEVEADSVDEAVEKAWDEYQNVSPSLCHHCSQELDDGGPVRMIVNTESGVEVYDDGCEAAHIVKLKDQVERLSKIESAAKALMGWIEAKHRPPVREEFERGTMASVRLHALADLHDALSEKDK